MNQLPELDKVREALSGFADMVNANVSGMSELAREEAEAAKKIKELAEFQKKLLEQTAKALGSFGSALLDVNKSGFAKFNDSIDQGTNVLKAFVESIPIFGKALGLLIKGAGEVAKQFTEQADNVSKANDSLKKIGTAGSFTGEQLLKFGHNAGLTSKNLELLVKPMQAMGTNLTMLGTNSGAGAEAFAKLTAITTKQREEYQRLGVSQQELIQNQADYISLQAMGATALSKELKDTETLRKLTLEYTDNLQVLSKMTGKSAEQLKKDQEAAVNDKRFQVSQILLDQKARELERRGKAENRQDLLDEAKKIDIERQNRLSFLKEFGSLSKNAKATSEMAGVLASGDFTGATSGMARMSAFGYDARTAGRSLKAGADPKQLAAEAIQQFNQSQQKAVGVVGKAGTYQGEALLDKFLLNNLPGIVEDQEKNFVEERKKAEKELEKARKEGYDRLADANAMLTTATITAAQAVDKFTLAMNPLIKNPEEVAADKGKTEAASQAAAGVRPQMTENAGGAGFVAQSSGKRRNRSAFFGPDPRGGGAAGAGGAAGGPEAGHAVESGGGGPGGKPSDQPKLSRVTSKSGKSAMVNERYDSAFQGLIDYLDKSGYEINSLGGYVDRDVRGQPGVKSVHALGGAIDINPSTNPLSGTLVTDMPPEISEVAAALGLGWGGNWKSRKDAMHFSAARSEGGRLLQARKGGIFSGSKSGYPVELHGKEMVAPLNPSSILARLLTTPESEMKNALTVNNSVNSSQSNDNNALVDVMATVAGVLNEVLYTLKASKGVQDKLLQYSKT